MRLIDADELYSKVKTEANPYGKPTLEFLSGCLVLDIIDKQPTIEAKPIVCGENITKMNPVDEFICSVCGFCCEDIHQIEYDEDDEDFSHHEYEFKFCPNCGAEMKGENQ